MKNAIGNLLRIVQKLWVALGTIVILTILILPIQEHGISFHLFVLSMISFTSVLQFSVYSSFVSLGKFSVQFSRSVVSGSLWPHESQHARPPCSSPSPGIHSDSRPLSQWCHPAISFSVVPFSCPYSLPASESFPMSQLFTWGGQSIGVSALASVLPKNTGTDLL